MSKMSDACKNGSYVWLNCRQCKTTVFTPVVETDEIAITISVLWHRLHTDRFPDHIVNRLVHYYA